MILKKKQKISKRNQTKKENKNEKDQNYIKRKINENKKDMFLKR